MNWNDIAGAALMLFLVMDPVGNAPIFNAILSRLEKGQRNRVLLRELAIALLVMLGFLFAGNSVLGFLGLSQPSLNIAGGVLLFIISLRMIFPGSKIIDESEQGEAPFIVPLAVPLIAGPSTIAVLLLLSSSQPEQLNAWCTALVIAWCATAAILLLSRLLLEAIGSRAARALERLMGMILNIIATQMLLDGIEGFVRSL